MGKTRIEFKDELTELFMKAETLGFVSVDIKSGELHRRVGDYPGHDHRMPVCCGVMREAMNPGDQEVEAPRKGQGASLVIRYRLPRGF